MANRRRFKNQNKKIRKKQRDSGYFDLSDVDYTDTKMVSINRKKVLVTCSLNSRKLFKIILNNTML